MTKVSFECGWGQTSHDLFQLYKKQTPHSSGLWENIQGVEKSDDADVIVLLGNVTNYNTDKKIIQFRREPDFIMPFKPHTKSLSFDYKDCGYHVSTWQFISKPFDELVDYPYHNKQKKVSGVTSAKWNHRNNFFSGVSQLGLEVDLFGSKYKSLHPKYKDDALFPYEFSIAVENSSQENYFSEKINDCFLSWSIPIYWGCPNIDEYFPEGSYRQVDINNPESLTDILNQPITKKNLDALTDARNLVMYKYNIWSVINILLK